MAKKPGVTEVPRELPPDEGYDAQYRIDPKDPTATFSDDERRELKRLQRLPDTQVLAMAGTMGPALLGRPLFVRVSQIRGNNPEGTLGPALIDPDYLDNQLKARGLQRDREGRIYEIGAPKAPAAPAPDPEPGAPADPGPYDPRDLTDARNPWTYVTLSGAKQLAIQHQISHKPRPKREDLIAQLQDAGVVPPPAPTPDELATDDDELTP
jgi:hypothetical protein